MAGSGGNQLMQVFEILPIACQNGEILGNRVVSTRASVADSKPTSLARIGSCPRDFKIEARRGLLIFSSIRNFIPPRVR